jgi:uncharacterized membrane protein
VDQTIVEEQLISNNLLHPPKETLTPGQRLSDRIARFGGSWPFIVMFVFILLFWIGFNVVELQYRFDPYPFILLNLMLSCVAALQAPIILMSQNRGEEKDRMRAENDYLVNLKAELEIRSLHQKIDLLMEDQLKIMFESNAQQLAKLESLEAKIEKLADGK